MTLEIAAFGGPWNTVVRAVAVLAACNLALGAVALGLLRRASRAEVQ